MILRKMTPRDGWRPFVVEVGKIVLGVLVALGLGAVATEIGWRVEVGRARDALAFELGETVGQAQERINHSPCVERRLDELTRIVEQAAVDGRLPPLGAINKPEFWTWNRGVWDSAVSSQAATHFPREEAGAFVGANEFVTILRDTSLRELEVWTRLYGLVGPGRRVSPEEVAGFRAAIAEARLLNRVMAMSGIRARQMVTAYGLKYDAATARDYAETPTSDVPICGPIAADAPPTYGHAPLQNIIRDATENPITRDSGRG